MKYVTYGQSEDIVIEVCFFFLLSRKHSRLLKTSMDCLLFPRSLLNPS